MKFKKYSLLFLFAQTFFSAQNYDYDSDVISYTVLTEDKTKAYEKAFFDDGMFLPESFFTGMADIQRGYDISKEDFQGKNGKIELKTILYDNYYTTTPFTNQIVDGIKKIYFPNGQLFKEIPFKNGKIEGMAKEYDQYGKTVSETSYKANLKNGRKRVYFKDSQDRYEQNEFIIEGNYKNGQLTGPLTISTKDLKIIYPSDFKKGKIELLYNGVALVDYSIIERNVKNGIYTSYSIDPKKENEPNPSAGKKEKEKTERIKRFSATYFNNQFNGYVEKYNKKGELLSKNLFSFGKPVGIHKAYYDVGKIKSEAYYDDNGKKTGIWKTYFIDGNLSTVTHYRNDLPDGATETYQNGIVAIKEVFDNGDRTSNTYFDNTGRIKSEAFYSKNNFLKEMIYYPEGQLQSVMTTNDKKIYYDKNGNIIHTDHYRNKKQVGIHKYFNSDKDHNLYVYSETEYDDNGKKIRSAWFGSSKKAMSEVSWKDDRRHGKSTVISEDGIKKVTYFFEGKEVTEQEFKKLSEENKENRKDK